jgi:putative endonuclease
MPALYILKCNDGSYYIGSSNDANRRLKDHLKGKCKYTKSRLPIRLVYKEEFATLSEASRREKQIKNWKSRKATERLIK